MNYSESLSERLESLMKKISGRRAEFGPPQERLYDELCNITDTLFSLLWVVEMFLSCPEPKPEPEKKPTATELLYQELKEGKTAYKTLLPGSDKWHQYWYEHPEERDEMQDFYRAHLTELYYKARKEEKGDPNGNNP